VFVVHNRIVDIGDVPGSPVVGSTNPFSPNLNPFSPNFSVGTDVGNRQSSPDFTSHGMSTSLETTSGVAAAQFSEQSIIGHETILSMSADSIVVTTDREISLGELAMEESRTFDKDISSGPAAEDLRQGVTSVLINVGTSAQAYVTETGLVTTSSCSVITVITESTNIAAAALAKVDRDCLISGQVLTQLGNGKPLKTSEAGYNVDQTVENNATGTSYDSRSATDVQKEATQADGAALLPTNQEARLGVNAGRSPPINLTPPTVGQLRTGAQAEVGANLCSLLSSTMCVACPSVVSARAAPPTLVMPPPGIVSAFSSGGVVSPAVVSTGMNVMSGISTGIALQAMVSPNLSRANASPSSAFNAGLVSPFVTSISDPVSRIVTNISASPISVVSTPGLTTAQTTPVGRASPSVVCSKVAPVTSIKADITSPSVGGTSVASPTRTSAGMASSILVGMLWTPVNGIDSHHSALTEKVVPEIVTEKNSVVPRPLVSKLQYMDNSAESTQLKSLPGADAERLPAPLGKIVNSGVTPSLNTVGNHLGVTAIQATTFTKTTLQNSATKSGGVHDPPKSGAFIPTTLSNGDVTGS